MQQAFTQFEVLILVRLVIAHLLADFLLQPDNWVVERAKNKARSMHLYLHGLVVGGLTYIFLADWGQVWLPLFVMVTHVIIDIWKSYQKDNTRNFVIDQLLHLAIILTAWIFYAGVAASTYQFFQEIFSNLKGWAIVMTYIIVIWPTGYLVAKSTARWREEIHINKEEVKGLNDAGKWIGRIERFLIITFILFSRYEFIGFLIASKSILRFSEVKGNRDRKEAEYILIGTLLSFAIAVVSGIMIKYLLEIEYN